MKQYVKQDLLNKGDEASYYETAGWLTQKGKKIYEVWYEKDKKENTMPCTHLGYTWYKEGYGFSEFCVRPKVSFKINGIFSIDQYASQEMFDRFQNKIKDNINQSIAKNVAEFNSYKESITGFINRTPLDLVKKQLMNTILENIYTQDTKTIFNANQCLYLLTEELSLNHSIKSGDTNTQALLKKYSENSYKIAQEKAIDNLKRNFFKTWQISNIVTKAINSFFTGFDSKMIIAVNAHSILKNLYKEEAMKAFPDIKNSLKNQLDSMEKDLSPWIKFRTNMQQLVLQEIMTDSTFNTMINDYFAKNLKAKVKQLIDDLATQAK